MFHNAWRPLSLKRCNHELVYFDGLAQENVAIVVHEPLDVTSYIYYRYAVGSDKTHGLAISQRNDWCEGKDNRTSHE